MKRSRKISGVEKMLGRIRKEYHFGQLDRQDLCPDPLDQFARWLKDAVERHQDAKAGI